MQFLTLSESVKLRQVAKVFDEACKCACERDPAELEIRLAEVDARVEQMKNFLDLKHIGGEKSVTRGQFEKMTMSYSKELKLNEPV